MSTGCTYELAFMGPCGMATVNSDRCVKHVTARCISCGKPATRECDASIGVCCGYPLCDDCGHSIKQRHVSKQQAERDFVDWEIERKQVKAATLASEIASLERKRDALSTPARHPSHSPFARQRT
jgi:hypothetical protein